LLLFHEKKLDSLYFFMKRKRWFTLALLLVCCWMCVQHVAAQIPADAKAVMVKAQSWFDNPKGMRMQYTIKVAKIVSIDGVMAGKSGKFYMKAAEIESGYDGVQQWTYDGTKKTVTIQKISVEEAKKNELSVDMQITESYQRCKMVEKDGIYSLTFTKPKVKDAPKSVVLRVRKTDYRPTELKLSNGMLSMRFLIKNITFGVNEKIFQFDKSKYPNAKIKYE